MNQITIIRENIDSVTVKAFFALFSEMEDRYKDQMVTASPEEVVILQSKIKFLREVKGLLNCVPLPPGKYDGAYV